MTPIPWIAQEPSFLIQARAAGLRAARWWVVVFLINAFFESPATAAPAADSGLANSTVLTVEGKVEVMKGGTTAWTPVQTNQVLRTGDRFRTALKSRATIRLSNQSTLRVNQLTTFEIASSTTQAGQAVLDLKAGAAYLFSRDQPVETQFRTPQASGAIRGTEIDIKVAETGITVVTLLDGLVDLFNDQGSVSLKSGEQGTVESAKAPAKTSVLDAANVIQWALYYPGVLDLKEIALDASEQLALAPSLEAYRAGELLRAVALYPDDRDPITDAERLYKAAMYLASGQLEEADRNIAKLTALSPLSSALSQVVAAVKLKPFERSGKPTTASEWLAESIYLQAQGKLSEAREAARASLKISPDFSYAWARLAELEFGFGRTDATQQAVSNALQHAPKNASAHAIQGFVFAAKNKISEARAAFEKAIELDPALGNAWLGLGLVKIRKGDAEAGRQDLQTAAALEPNRAMLRSYLGKAYSNSRDLDRAQRELTRSLELDPNDPTAWLYSSLLNQQLNRINEAVTDLERSQELNDNRSLFRSQLLLDQDRAVRGVNLASIYRDAGMTEFSVREASRAVVYDYANSAAHLFLANSYDALLDPKKMNLRYETPYFSEFLMASLLAPVGAGSLSQNISQQEYSKLMEKNGFGLSSSTEYLSSGEWRQRAGHVGVFGNSAYGLDFEYRTDPGQRPNNDVEESIYYFNFKQQLSPKDTLFVYTIYQDFESGDVAQLYNNQVGYTPIRVEDIQGPQFFAGYNHEWAPGVNTLLLAGRFESDLDRQQPLDTSILGHYFSNQGRLTRIQQESIPWTGSREVEFYTIEAQQIWQTPKHSLIVGLKYQDGEADTYTFVSKNQVRINETLESDFDRFSAYAYYHWQIAEPLRLIAGLSYDHMNYPANIDSPPASAESRNEDLVAPKAGLIYTPWKGANLRAAVTRSLGGLSTDASIRLEPTQVAGFNQAFRSIAPESALGMIPGSEFTTYHTSFEQALKSNTYLAVDAELLESSASRSVGHISFTGFLPVRVGKGSTSQNVDYQERSLSLTANQLLGREWSLGAQYRISEAEAQGEAPDLQSSIPGAIAYFYDRTAILHRVTLYAQYYHRCGFFSSVYSSWHQQSNQGSDALLAGDDFWQFHAFAGYRFHRRLAEVRVGLLNITDQDYRLNPLNLYNELPRERTFTATFRFNF